jgi:hypothetical protein
MARVDREKLREVIAKIPLLTVERSHGERGTQSFRDLATVIMTVFDYVEPEQFPGVIIIFKCLDDSHRPIAEDNAVVIHNPAVLGQETQGDVVLQALSDGRLLLWKNMQVDIASVAAGAVVYRYQGRREFFFAGTSETEVEKVGQYASLYAIPAFSDVRQALEHYRTDMAKESSCKILEGVWADPKRLFLVNGPEDTMRDSLIQFLKITVRDAETRPEQNMNARRPVDIKVTFNFSPRIAVIEIKWIGVSIHNDGRIAVRYTDARARVGANQLVRYLNWNKQETPNHITRGYLVVFDARRRGLKKNAVAVSRPKGAYYRNREVKFNPRFDKTRSDFERPIRMFMEPVY